MGWPALTYEQNWIERVDLIRLMRDWNKDSGNTAMCFAARSLMPAETKAIIEFVREVPAAVGQSLPIMMSRDRPITDFLIGKAELEWLIGS